MNKPVAWVDSVCLALIHKCKAEWIKVYREKKDDEYIPLYTHQYERPHNTVLVPCDKLAEMQEKLTKYELRNEEQRNRIAILEAQVYGGTTK